MSKEVIISANRFALRAVRFTAALLMLSIISLSCGADANTLTVDEVLSGDEVRFGDLIARLTGISAPPRTTGTGRRIFDFTRGEIEGKVVKVFTWTTDNTAAGIVYDEEGRAFAQIFYGKGMETSINEILLKKGYARVDRERLPGDLAHYIDLEKEAREKGPGIWAGGRDSTRARP